MKFKNNNNYKNYASTSLSYLPPLNFYHHNINKTNDKSTINKYYNNDDSYRGENNNKMLRTSSQSIKEFSYFDWSKVKLYDTTNSSLIDIISNTNESNNNNNNNTLVTTNNNNNNDLPQVITIRFT